MGFGQKTDNVLAKMTETESVLSRVPERYIELIKRTIAPGASDVELEQFLYVSATYNLDPLMKEIIWFKSKGKPNHVITRDGYLKIAHRNQDFDGLVSFVVKEGDHFKVDPPNHAVEHTFGTKRGKILGAWAIAYHKRRPPMLYFADFAEYRKRNNNAWDNYPSAMIQKTAESHVLRKQFDISGTTGGEETGLVDLDGKIINNGDSFIDITVPDKVLDAEFTENTIRESEDEDEAIIDDLMNEVGKRDNNKENNDHPKNKNEKNGDELVIDDKKQEVPLEKEKEDVESPKVEKEDKKLKLGEMDLSNVESLKEILKHTEIEITQDNLLELAKKLLHRGKIDVTQFVQLKGDIKDVE